MRRLPLFVLTLAGALLIAALTLYAYRELPARPFAADDYQWLLNVRGLGGRELLRTAFDPSAQTHFYRPLVWLLFWAQLRAFGLEPRGFHMVSLGLHLLNAGLTGWLAYRLTKDQGRMTKDWQAAPSSFVIRRSSAVAAVAIVALHPAPFEAVAWVSAQSELLAAALLLLALHLWIGRRRANDQRPNSATRQDDNHSSFVVRPWPILATLALALALLAKESAAIGLALLVLLGWPSRGGTRHESGEPAVDTPGTQVSGKSSRLLSHVSGLKLAAYLLPCLVTLAYVALQVGITRRNYLLAQGGYGLGPQLLLNPLRSLALLAAPLPGSEHADAAWLVPAGAALALLLLALLLRGPAGARRLVLALGVTLLPTAPFASPPDSRYLYLPAMAAALLIGFTIYDLRFTIVARAVIVNRKSKIVNWLLAGVFVLVLALTSRWAAFELHEREWRFAAGAGPGGSLWRAASQFCAAAPPERVVLVEPPIAPPHAEAIIALACGPDTRTLIVARDQAEGAVKGRSVVVGFPGGSATVERTT